MPRVNANGVGMNYDQQGTGEPLLLIPYLAADHACYAFQVAEYAKHFTCISIDLRGSGSSDDPEGDYTTETLADDVAALMQALGIANAHISGLSLGANIGMAEALRWEEYQFVLPPGAYALWLENEGAAVTPAVAVTLVDQARQELHINVRQPR